MSKIYNKHLFTSESVSEGHPDKVSDIVSDSIVDACLAQDPNSRVACETLCTTDLVVIAGEITTKAKVDFEKVARNAIKEIGYTSKDIGFCADTCKVEVHIHEQSPDISQGVTEGEGQFKEQGAGDQGMMFGYASNATPELMPAPIIYSHKMVKKLADLRKSGELKYVRPDSKGQVTILHDKRVPKYVETVVLSTQHTPEVSHEQIEKDLIEKVIKKVIPAKLLTEHTKYYINPTGRFVMGGPHGDCGLTGRKIIVDTYGGVGSHGGGAFSGKDPSKVDRSAAYMARYVAKNIVASGIAGKCEVQLAYAIGVAKPVSINVDTYGTMKIDEKEIYKLIEKHFDLTPKGIITTLDLKKPIFRKTAAYGHFGREDQGFTWEKTDKAEILAKAAGIKVPAKV
ncbi:MAG: methionine adenosyltransferase [Candidatus Margulisbacteria bacterium]|nr:methionine adenosyltransferase [Candidatus Margulisiibacteriota bacterium]